MHKQERQVVSDLLMHHLTERLAILHDIPCSLYRYIHISHDQLYSQLGNQDGLNKCCRPAARNDTIVHGPLLQ